MEPKSRAISLVSNRIPSPSTEGSLEDSNWLNGYGFLIFHNDKAQQNHMLNTLRFCGVTHLSVADKVEQALHQVVANRVSFVFAGHFGEGKETTRLIRELKSNDSTANLPVFAITNTAEIKDLLKIIAKGFDDVLVLPLSQEVVEDKISAYLDHNERLRGEQEALGTVRQLVDDGKYEQALLVLNPFLSGPDQPLKATLELAKIRIATGRLDDGLHLLQEASGRAKRGGDKLRQHLDLSEVFLVYGLYFENQGKSQRATKCYRTAFNLAPINTANLGRLLAALQKEDELKEILAAIAKAREYLAPFSPQMAEVAGQVHGIFQNYREMGLEEHAKSIHNELLEIRHDNPEVHLRQIDFASEQGVVWSIIGKLIEAAWQIKNPDLFYRVGTILVRESEGNRAASLPVDLRDYGLPQPTDWHLKNWNLWLAREFFRKAMLSSPDDPRHRIGLATTEMRLGESSAAQQIIQQINAHNFNSIPFFREVIKTLIRNKQFDSAEKWLRQTSKKFKEPRQLAELVAELNAARRIKPQRTAGLIEEKLKRNQDYDAMLLGLAEALFEGQE